MSREEHPSGVSATSEFGANDWLVDEMYEKYRRNPESVGPSWQEFFADYAGRGNGRAPETAGEAIAADLRPTETAPQPAPAAEPDATPDSTATPQAQTLR